MWIYWTFPTFSTVEGVEAFGTCNQKPFGHSDGRELAWKPGHGMWTLRGL